MIRYKTKQKNKKFNKYLSNFKRITNVFLAGLVSGAIALGVMQGCKEEPIERKDLETRIESVEKIEGVNDYKRYCLSR